MQRMHANVWGQRTSDANAKGSPKRSRWCLVLCLERGYKEEFTEQRECLTNYVKRNGGTMLCMKKHENFKSWLDSNTKPYVLITGWREAKPSSNHFVSSPPEAFFVLAESDVSYARASDWAAESGVMLLRSLSLGDQLSATVESLVNSKTARLPAKMLPSCSYQGHKADETGSEQFSSPLVCGLPTPGCTTDIKDIRSGPQPALDLLTLMKELSSYQNAKETEAVLLEAMPTFYED
eukprot:TRINITY_DN12744_c0_g1_i1.p1 TRINITY_DN12744_c0_g1~~TRINITY_DN12744_c0_g1_i1.p1  ORF type:complete len:236 (+),score=42.08 TRINITY_DN12744_c0_g1_i1:133-840(+)